MQGANGSSGSKVAQPLKFSIHVHILTMLPLNIIWPSFRTKLAQLRDWLLVFAKKLI